MSYAYHMLSNVEKEKLVIDLYYNQRKNVRQIAQEARISFRHIGTIIKKRHHPYYDKYHKGLVEIAKGFFNILSSQLVDNMMVAAVKELLVY